MTGRGPCSAMRLSICERNYASPPVELVFFYKSYCETAREELLLNISRLLDSYGASMDNRDHGKNLMHRLFLEGRLSVVELP